MGIRLETLGDLRVTKDGQEIAPLPGPLRCALLVHLAIERSVSRETLARLLWPAQDPDKARHALSQMLYELKGALGDGWVDASSASLAATSQLTCDALDFLELAEGADVMRAGALYRGTFLQSTVLVPHQEYRAWVDRMQNRFASAYRYAQSASVQRLQEAGDNDEALEAAQHWVDREPLDDDAHARLIELFARCGRRREALRHWEKYRTLLDGLDELPPTATVDLVGRIKDGSVGRPPVKGTETRTGASPGLQLRVGAKAGLVVFPITCLSRDDADRFFCDGLAHEINHALSRVPGLRLVPRKTADDPESRGSEIKSAIEALGVTHALEGTVEFVGDRFTAYIYLLQGDPEEMLFVERFHGTRLTDDEFELRDGIAVSVVGTLAERLGLATDERATHDQVVVTSGTSDILAMEAYKRGREAWESRSPDRLTKALDHLDQATARDARFARAHAAKADVYLVLGGIDYMDRPPAEIYERAREYALKACELDPHLANAHAALGNYSMSFGWSRCKPPGAASEWHKAEEHLERAVALNPGYTLARQWLSNLLMYTGRTEEALDQARLAHLLNPSAVPLRSSLARHYQLARQWDTAAEHYRHALEKDPAFAGALIGSALVELQRGNTASATTIIARVSARTGRVTPLLMAVDSYVAAHAGDRDRARSLLTRLTPGSGQGSGYVPPACVAMAHLGLDEHDQALDWLDRAFERGSQTLSMLGVEPIFDPIRGEPRFDDLLERVGLSEYF
jgi:DNA-binding SARP family transcriptional activator/TolB-like protein/tetratricopeptide (TPR) repeat protein